MIRRLWREILFGGYQQSLNVYAALLRNNLVPSSQLEEAHRWVASHLNSDIPSAADSESLRQWGFWRAYEELAFARRKIDEFEWGNRNAGAIRWYLETNDLSEEAVEAICNTFRSEPYPFQVRDALVELFREDSHKRDEFVDISGRLALRPPTSLGFPAAESGHSVDD